MAELWVTLLEVLQTHAAGLLALLLSTITWFHSRRDRRLDRSREIYDEFWIRSFIFPQIVLPTVEYLTNLAAQCDLLPRPPTVDVNSKFFTEAQTRLMDFQTRMRVLRVLSDDFYKGAVAIPDSVIEDIASYLEYSNAVIGGTPLPKDSLTPIALRERCLEAVHELAALVRTHQLRL